MSESDIVWTRERWRLRNGSYAVIEQRAGSIAVGSVDGSDQIHTWLHGKTFAGAGYDLVELEDATTGRKE